MRRNPRHQTLDPLQPLSRESQISSNLAVEPRKKEGTAYVGEETDGCFGHGEEGAFGCYADGGVDGDADAASH